MRVGAVACGCGAALVLAALSALPAQAEEPALAFLGWGRPSWPCTPYYQPVCPPPPYCLPAPTPSAPERAPEAAPPETVTEPTLPAGRLAAFGGETVAVAGYVDSAIPASLLRIRFDAAYDNVRPDRAEFFYAKCGCFRPPAAAPLQDPNAPGPPLAETSVDYQDVTAYLECAFAPTLSAFVEVPLRFLNPEVNDNTAGLADIQAGFKYAFVYSPELVATFQLRAYFPTGDAGRGLGTDHYSLEPGLLVNCRCSECLILEGQARYWIPIDGTDFAGDVAIYGVSLSYLAVQNCDGWVAPVVELVGWTVIDGKALVVHPSGNGSIEDASGDTIVNAKFGVRVGCGGGDIYVGYGRALTGDTWYQDLARLELRLYY